jgi:hypothetical protein
MFILLFFVENVTFKFMEQNDCRIVALINDNNQLLSLQVGVLICIFFFVFIDNFCFSL